MSQYCPSTERLMRSGKSITCACTLGLSSSVVADIHTVNGNGHTFDGNGASYWVRCPTCRYHAIPLTCYIGRPGWQWRRDQACSDDEVCPMATSTPCIPLTFGRCSFRIKISGTYSVGTHSSLQRIGAAQHGMCHPERQSPELARARVQRVEPRAADDVQADYR